jgi:concanavalin A-like lectin/glucanase superfamily protein
MTDHFDPYHKWLGIPRWEQPPNHYRLLGLTTFESDLDVIESGADQRMAHVRTFQSSAHSAESQRLLNELATAKLCLLTPDRKQVYDTDLMAKQKSPLVAPTAKWPTVEPTEAGSEPLQVAPAAKRRRPRMTLPETSPTESGSTKELLLVAGLVAAGLVGFVVYKAREDRRLHEAPVEQAVETGTLASIESSSDLQVDPFGTVASNRGAKPISMPPKKRDEVDRKPSTTREEKALPTPEKMATKQSVVEHPAVPASTPTLAALDLLSGAAAWYNAESGADDLIGAHHGKLEGDVALIASGIGHAFGFDGSGGSVVVPHAPELSPAKQFTVMAWINPRSTKEGAIISKIRTEPGGNAGYQFGVGEGNGSLFVQFNAPGESWPTNRLSIEVAKPVPVGEWRHVTGCYDGDKLHLFENGALVGSKHIGAKMVATSTANFRISGDDNRAVYFDGLLDEAALFDRALTASEIETIYQGTSAGKIDRQKPNLGGLSKAHESLLARHANAGTVDVLPLIDPARDSLAGKWTKDDGGLHSPPDAMHSYLRLPIVVPREYELNLVVQAGQVEHSEFLVTLLAGNKQFQALVGDVISGLQFIDGAWWNNNETSVKDGLLQRGVDHAVSYVVRQTGIEVWFDERRIIHWQGDRDRLTPYGNVSSPLRLLLATHSSHHFKAIRLTPLSDARFAPDTTKQPTIDLLKTIDLKRHIVRGPWSLDGPILIAPSSPHSILRIPGAIPNEYALRVVAEVPRDHQGGREFSIGLVAPPSQVQVVLDSESLSGLDKLGGKAFNANGTTYQGQLFVPGVESVIDSFVREDGIRIEFDGRTIIDWKGDRQRLTSGWSKLGAPKRNLYLAMHHKFLVKKMELLPLQEDRIPPGGWPIPAKQVDVLKLIKPNRDSVRGGWTLDGESLVSPANEHLACLKLPVGVPEEYSLAIEATRTKGQNATLHLGLVSGTSQCLVILDAGGRSGIDLVDGLRFDVNETTTDAGRLREGAIVRIECVVSKAGIQVTLDGKPIVDWRGGRDRLSVLSLWPGQAVPGLFLSTHGSYRFSAVEMRPVGSN